MPTQQISITVDEQTKQYLEQEAAERDRTMSYIAREMIRSELPSDADLEAIFS